MKKVKTSKLIIGLLIISLSLTGFTLNSKTTPTKANPKTIVVGTGNAFKPYCYLDDKGNPIGFEIAVLKEVNKILPQYKFEFQALDFKNILIGVDAGKIDLAAHEYAKNDEREKKYLFATEGYTKVVDKITVLKTNKDINSIADLEGKTIKVSPGAQDAYVLEKYNSEHGNKIKLYYSGADIATTIKDLQDGRIDAFVSLTRNVDGYNKAFGNILKIVGRPIYNSYTYYIYPKGDTQLRDDVDKAIKALRLSGILSKLSKDYLGADYVK